MESHQSNLWFSVSLSATAASETYLLTAEFQQTNGGRFYDQIVLEPPQGAYAAKGTTVPTTFISEEPSTGPSSAPTSQPILSLEPPTLISAHPRGTHRRLRLWSSSRISRAPGTSSMSWAASPITLARWSANCPSIAACRRTSGTPRPRVPGLLLSICSTSISPSPFASPSIRSPKFNPSTSRRQELAELRPSLGGVYLLGGLLFVLHEQKLIDLRDPENPWHRISPCYSTVLPGLRASAHPPRSKWPR